MIALYSINSGALWAANVATVNGRRRADPLTTWGLEYHQGIGVAVHPRYRARCFLALRFMKSEIGAGHARHPVLNARMARAQGIALVGMIVLGVACPDGHRAGTGVRCCPKPGRSPTSP